MEKWRDIINFEGRYQVSNQGRVRSLINDIILKEETHWKGHKKVCLCLNGLCKKYFVHRLVAIMFIPKIDEERIVVNHKDGNKTNNNIKNLEWMTIAENTQHYYDGLITEDVDF